MRQCWLNRNHSPDKRHAKFGGSIHQSGHAKEVWLICAGLALLGLSFFESGCKREGAAPPVVEMKPVLSKSEYRLDEQIVISIAITNQGDKPCRISGVPEGSIKLDSFTRDGIPLKPVLSIRRYIDGFESFLASNTI